MEARRMEAQRQEVEDMITLPQTHSPNTDPRHSSNMDPRPNKVMDRPNKVMAFPTAVTATAQHTQDLRLRQVTDQATDQAVAALTLEEFSNRYRKFYKCKHLCRNFMKIF